MITVTVKTTVEAPKEQAWEYYTAPEHITQWNFATDDWHCPHATNDLKEGGKLRSRMEKRDGTFGFDFEGTYTEVDAPNHLAYQLSDGRNVHATFTDSLNSTQVAVTFEVEDENTREMQEQGWQAILDRYQEYTNAN